MTRANLLIEANVDASPAMLAAAVAILALVALLPVLHHLLRASAADDWLRCYVATLRTALRHGCPSLAARRPFPRPTLRQQMVDRGRFCHGAHCHCYDIKLLAARLIVSKEQEESELERGHVVMVQVN